MYVLYVLQRGLRLPFSARSILTDPRTAVSRWISYINYMKGTIPDPGWKYPRRKRSVMGLAGGLLGKVQMGARNF